MEYQPPPAFGPPESRIGPLRPDEAIALLGQQQAPGYAAPEPRALPPVPRARLVAAGVLAIALVAAGIIALVGVLGSNTDRSRRTISLPDMAGNYQLIRSIDGQSIEAMLGSQLGSLGPIQGALDSAKVGVYGLGPNAGPTIVFLGFSAADSASIRQLLASAGSDAVVTEVMSGAGASVPRAIGPGQLGGALQCSQAIKNGTSFTPCVWADNDTLAMVLQIGIVDVDDAGAVTLQFRSAAEH
ncbi:MAG: hypothetical protein ACRDWT_13220 [Jatrophihabitantaceae bacterium]